MFDQRVACKVCRESKGAEESGLPWIKAKKGVVAFTQECCAEATPCPQLRRGEEHSAHTFHVLKPQSKDCVRLGPGHREEHIRFHPAHPPFYTLHPYQSLPSAFYPCCKSHRGIAFLECSRPDDLGPCFLEFLAYKPGVERPGALRSRYVYSQSLLTNPI